VQLNVCSTYPFIFIFYLYVCYTIILADLPTIWGDFVFYYQTMPDSQLAGGLHDAWPKTVHQTCSGNIASWPIIGAVK
jgi:hypothetical protein